MSKLLSLSIAVFFVLLSCTTNPAPKVDYAFPHTGTSNNAAIVVKDYETLGIIFVKSTEIIDSSGNHTGSKITHEMLMLEAQKLDADDVINVRIDVNPVEGFSATGELISTTYNYTASALAIKYTAAAAGATTVSAPQLMANSEISPVEMRRPKYTAPIMLNWVSAGANILGGGLRYERMINQYVSLGGNTYYQSFGISKNAFGLDFVARAYPFGRIFYIGAGLGFTNYEYSYEESDYWGYDTVKDRSSGFAISPEIGVKILFNQQRRFFMDISYKTPLIFGGSGFELNMVPQVAFGAAF